MSAAAKPASGAVALPGPRTLWQALRRGTLGLSGRIVLLSLALLLLVQGAGFLVIRENIDRNAHRQLADRLGLAERVWQHLLEQRASKLSQSAAVRAADYGIREVLGTRDPMRVDIRAQASVGLWVGPAPGRVHPLCRADRLRAPAHAVDLGPGRQPAGGDGPAGCAAHLGEPVYPRPDTATCPTSSTPSCAATMRWPTASAWSSELKIDKRFVMAMQRAPGDAMIVRSTIDLAHTLGLTMVAEGIEDEAILA